MQSDLFGSLGVGSRLPCPLETELGLALNGGFLPILIGVSKLPTPDSCLGPALGVGGGWVFNCLKVEASCHLLPLSSSGRPGARGWVPTRGGQDSGPGVGEQLPQPVHWAWDCPGQRVCN